MNNSWYSVPLRITVSHFLIMSCCALWLPAAPFPLPAPLACYTLSSSQHRALKPLVFGRVGTVTIFMAPLTHIPSPRAASAFSSLSLRRPHVSLSRASSRAFSRACLYSIYTMPIPSRDMNCCRTSRYSPYTAYLRLLPAPLIGRSPSLSTLHD